MASHPRGAEIQPSVLRSPTEVFAVSDFATWCAGLGCRQKGLSSLGSPEKRGSRPRSWGVGVLSCWS